MFGAYGHTARFVFAEWLRRGIIPILAGRNSSKLTALTEKFPTLQRRVASATRRLSIARFKETKS